MLLRELLILLIDDDVDGPGFGCASPASRSRQISHTTCTINAKTHNTCDTNFWFLLQALFRSNRLDLKQRPGLDSVCI